MFSLYKKEKWNKTIRLQNTQQIVPIKLTAIDLKKTSVERIKSSLLSN